MCERFRNLPPGTSTLIVIDDDEDLLLVVRMALVAEGFNVVLSVNGMNVYNLLETESPDLVLLDVAMDGVDGTDICKAIKTNPATVAIPVLLFSANRNIDEIARECGADGFINKPFELTDLTQKINSLILSRSSKL